MTTPCPSPTDLRGLVNGSLSDSEADNLQLHLERCVTCQNALQEIVADGDFWKSAAENLSDDEAAGPGLERVVEELQQQSPEDAEQMGEAIELKLSLIDPPTEPGTIGRLKHYDILRVAGRGGMGIVLKAFDRTLRRVVAVKMLAPHLAGNGQAKQRFIREGRSAAGICHEHVVTIHAVEESPPFIVMQYVKGETLEARIHLNGSLEVREAIRIAKQIAQGLTAAHTQGVVHRDIKPANILLENGVARVRITDFGLARAVDDASLTQSGVVAGTPQYMAPEQANGDAVDERADLFSLGSVLYTMLAGHAPFRATTTMGVLKRLCDNTARPIREINPDVPEWLVMLINRLHAKRPADRYQSAQEVADVLERGLASLQNGAAPTVEFAMPQSDPSSGVGNKAAPAATRRHSFAPGRTSSRAVEVSMPKWLLPIPVWLVVIALLLVMLGPLGQEASIIATMLLIGLCFVGMLVYFVKKLMIEPEPAGDSGEPSELVDSSFEERARRLVKRLCEITPANWSGRLGWLILWCLPLAVWVVMFYLQEEWALRMHVESLADRDRDIGITLAGVFCLWWLIAIAWFRRCREDGSQLFERGRWLRVLTTLLFATAFCTIGYDVWYSDVYRLKLYYEGRQGQPFYTGRSNQATATIVQTAPSCMVRLNFDVAVDGLEVVIKFSEGRTSTFSPAHHGVMVLLSEAPGTYEWRAILKGRHVASGKVTLAVNQLAVIKVPRPKLIQLIAGRWESDPARDRTAGGGMYGGAEDAPDHYELEFAGDTATLAITEQSPAILQWDDMRVEIDESVTPALIDLKVAEGTLMGIVRFQAGRKDHFQVHGSHMLSPVTPGVTSMTMEDDSAAEGAASPGGGFARSFGGAPIATASEPDRLLICVTQGSGLRPWEFQADDERGHMLFALVRSREPGSLREKLAFEPVQLETPHDLVKESVQAWSKRLKIDGTGTNSAGMELVLVPPAAYHLVDQPHLSKLRIQLPEPGSIRDSIEQDPAFKYQFPPKLKEQISKKYKFISYPFVMSRRLVTTDQFRQFVNETGYVTDAERGTILLSEVAADSDSALPGASPKPGDEAAAKPTSATVENGGWRRESGLFNWADGLSWKNPISADVGGLDLSVSAISWGDATEFCKWLSAKEGRQYRLPKNEEWTAAMQLGAARKQLPATNSDDPMINDYYGWFDAASKHPLGIARTNDIYAEWTQDAQVGSKLDRMVLVHHEESADGVRFYLGTQFNAGKSFRAVSVGFRVVAELQALTSGNPEEESSEDAPGELFK
jgi:serine/threonine protein kinase/formylglycine-generating enzyme required for sulfatase activity